jgi:hypothetical protein
MSVDTKYCPICRTTHPVTNFPIWPIPETLTLVRGPVCRVALIEAIMNGTKNHNHRTRVRKELRRWHPRAMLPTKSQFTGRANG